MPERHQTMKRILTLASLFATLAGPALAAQPADCSGLVQARAEARSAAAGLGYDVVTFDDGGARDFLRTQSIPPAMMADHITVLVDSKAGHAVMLLHDGPRCAFESVIVLGGKDATPLKSALTALQVIR